MRQRVITTTPPEGVAYVDDRAVADPGSPAYVVEQQVVTPGVAQRRVVSHRRFDPAAVLMVVGGIALTVVGAVAAARAGFDGPLDEPVVQVAGVSHTALLGVIEVAIGLLTILAGLSRDRGTMVFASIAFGVVALVAAIEPGIGGDSLAIERGWAVVLVVGFAVMALVAAVAPSMLRSTDRVETI
jgi:peptidoglycan/LPS O-acetylase OafA/YrhL